MERIGSEGAHCDRDRTRREEHTLTIPQKARELILAAEGFSSNPIWPGGASGVTIGFGYDLGYLSADQFVSDWNGLLAPSSSDRLKAAAGLRGLVARDRAAELADIEISRGAAEYVFELRSLPVYELRTAYAFPGVEALPENVRGALVSLVYNRGTAMVDHSPQDRRREMRAIRDAVARGDIAQIAAQLRLMKRLWEGEGLDGLIARREEEARLVESVVA